MRRLLQGVPGFFAVAAVLVAGLSGPACAQVSMSGLSGYWDTPTSELLADGSLEMGYNIIPESWAYDHRGQYANDVYFATLGFIPGVEVSVRFTALPGFIAYTQEDSASRLTDADRMVSAKVQILHSKGSLPDVAVGVEDPFGTRRFHAVYAVLGKSFRAGPFSVRADAGAAPVFAYRVTNRTLHGGFAGAEVRWRGRLALVGEYDTEKWNVGLKARGPLGLTGRMVWLNAQSLSLGVGLSVQL